MKAFMHDNMLASKHARKHVIIRVSNHVFRLADMIASELSFMLAVMQSCPHACQPGNLIHGEYFLSSGEGRSL
jgi:hypothetical protein